MRNDIARTHGPLTGFLSRLSDWVLTGLACCVVLIMVSVVVQVAASHLGVVTLWVFDHDVLLFGSGISHNSLTDLQWHLTALIVLGAMPIIWITDQHVRVDMVFGNLPERGKAAVDAVGHLLFMLPFLAMCIPAAWTMTQLAYTRGDGSANDGLVDLYLVKALIPMSFSTLLIIVIVDLVRSAKILISSRGARDGT